MTTDNRTNELTAEQIVSEALGPYGLIGRARDLAARNAVERLRAHGLLSEGTPSEAQVEAAAEAIHNLMQGDPSFKDSGRKREMRIYARAALVAAQGAARPVNGFDTTAERVKTGADSLHVAPQEPSGVTDINGHSWMTWDESGKNGTYCRSCGGWAGKVGNRQCSPAPSPDREKLIAEAAARARGEALIEAVQAHRNLHKTYGSTAACHGGIGGQAMTPHCASTCYNHDAHQVEVDAWHVIEGEAVEYSRARAAEIREGKLS